MIKHLLREIRLDDVRGRIILIPVLNPSAFLAGTRESGDDGVNLNRAFVEGAGITPGLCGITHRVAAFVRDQIWPRVHVVIDLHSGGTRFRVYPLAGYMLHPDPGVLDRQRRIFADLHDRRRWERHQTRIAFRGIGRRTEGQSEDRARPCVRLRARRHSASI